MVPIRKRASLDADWQSLHGSGHSPSLSGWKTAGHPRRSIAPAQRSAVQPNVLLVSQGSPRHLRLSTSTDCHRRCTARRSSLARRPCAERGGTTSDPAHVAQRGGGGTGRLVFTADQPWFWEQGSTTNVARRPGMPRAGNGALCMGIIDSFRGVLNGKKKKKCSGTSFPKKARGHSMCSTMVGGGWWLAVGGGWRLAVGNWRLVAVGGGWRRLVAGGWWLEAVGSGWQLAVGRRWRLAAVGGWRSVAVGGWRLPAVGS